MKEFIDYAEKDAEEYVETLSERAKSFGVPRSNGEVVSAISSPASAIVEKASKERVDLIVIATRGLDRPKRFLLGVSPLAWWRMQSPRYLS